MGKKRRIMTSGQKFIRKYRAFLEKAGDSTPGGDQIINVPGQGPVISEAEVYVHGNGEVSFRCFVDMLKNLHANDVVKLTLDGTALSDAPIANTATAESIAINGINPTGKTATGQPAEDVALKALSDVTVGNVMLASGGGQLVVAPGSHTLVANVLPNGGAVNPKHEKKIKFLVPTPKVDLSKISVSQGAGGGADAGKLIFAVAGGDSALNSTKAAGSCSGERGFDLDGSQGATKNKLSVKLFVQAGGTGAFEAIANPGGDIPAAASSLLTSAGINGKKTADLSLTAGDVVRIEITPCKKQAAGGAPDADTENVAGKLTLLHTITA